MTDSRRRAEARLKDYILEAQVEAALQGHDLGPFQPVDEPGLLKYQAFCFACGKYVCVSSVALYSILEDSCPGQEEA